jgi:hypothetical protein
LKEATPISQVLLKISKPIQDKIVTESGLEFFLDGSWNKEWNVTVTAKIAALPTKIHPKDKKIIEQLKVGDEVAISYQVVSDLNFGSDSERFMPVTEGNDLMREWVNGFGAKLAAYALPGIIAKIWVGVHQDKFGKLVDGIQGTESELNRWLAQFQLGKTDIYSFNNFFEVDGVEYWKCDLSQIFAKKVDGHLVSVGDRVIMKMVEEEVPEEVKKSLGYTTDDVKIRYQDRGRIISGGKAKGLKKDQVVSFNPAFCEKYNFWDKEYYLVREDRIQGIWSKN